jgi:hypothetical protein
MEGIKNNIRELIVCEGRITNAYNKNQPSILGMVDVKGWNGDKQTMKDAKIARMKALKKAIIFKKKGWKDVSIMPHYSYGINAPYRYEIEAWGGFDDKTKEFQFDVKESGKLSFRAKTHRGAKLKASGWERWLKKTGRGNDTVLKKTIKEMY